MTFIITLVALLIERFFDWSHLRHWTWFSRCLQWLSGKCARFSSYVTLAICIVPFLIIVGVINCVLSGWLYGTLKLLFGIIVLLYCLGPANLWVQVFQSLSELHKEDPNLVIQHAKQCFNVEADNLQKFHQALTRAIFIEANQRIFAVTFWFVILGPIGAVLYRLTELCYTKGAALGFSANALQVKNSLDWLPVRLFTFICALVGNFKRALTIWTKEFARGIQNNETLLSDCSMAALDVTQDGQLPEDGTAEKESLALIDRAFVAGLVILAAVVLIL